MNSEQAKKLSLPDLLARLRSPFRDEKTPSLQVSMGRTGIWIWNDHADTHGTVIDFVMRYQDYSSIKDALAFLDDLFQPGLFSTPTPRPQPQPKPIPDLFSFYQQSHRAAVENFSEDRTLEFIDAQPIRRSLILSYLADERHIPPTLAQRYLQEVRYRNLATAKEYFAFGMENQAGGFEIRVASSKHNFKSALKVRDITIIPGTGTDRTTAHIFEGMTDFLSYLVLTNTEQLADDAIIMHSLSSYDRAAAHIRAQDYQQLWTYLDNDKAGQQGTERFKADFGAKILPQGERFAPHKDLNLYLQAQRGKSGNGRS